MIFGIQDTCVAGAYLLSFGGALMCVGYGIVNWNTGDEPVKPEDLRWAKEEKEEVEPTV